MFGAQSEDERDKWITYIEYLRAKGVHDNFTKKFLPVNFPLETTTQKDRMQFTKQRE